MTHPPIDEQITFLYTRDLESTARFYEEVVGLPMVVDQGSCRIYRVSGNAFLGFCQRESAPETPRGIIVTVVTDAVDEWHAFLQARGVDFEKPPTINPDYEIYHCFLRDPNGYLIEIQQFLDPTWFQPEAA
ncbi:MAG: VOC family protein [Anaerolineae bacterium]|jgi:catechol 2,3-dioxygenase-like lactoylglutathione lyase family enzyme